MFVCSHLGIVNVWCLVHKAFSLLPQSSLHRLLFNSSNIFYIIDILSADVKTLVLISLTKWHILKSVPSAFCSKSHRYAVLTTDNNCDTEWYSAFEFGLTQIFRTRAECIQILFWSISWLCCHSDPCKSLFPSVLNEQTLLSTFLLVFLPEWPVKHSSQHCRTSLT